MLLRRAVEQFGRMSVAKAYSDWSAESYRRDMEMLYTAGIEPVYAPSKMPSGDEGQMRWAHNSVDIKLAVDCTMTAATRPDIGTFVLVTGDADFIHLVNSLRWQGRRVVVIGTSWNAARRLVENADVFIAYDGGVDRGLTSALMAVNRAQQRPPYRSAPPPVRVPQPVPVAEATPAPAAAHSSRSAPDPDDAFSALGGLIRSWPEGVRLSRLKGMLRERLGRFDERRIGFSRFERFAREAERRGIVRIEPGPDEPMAYPPGARIPADVTSRPSENGSSSERQKPAETSDERPEAAEVAEPLVEAAASIDEANGRDERGDVETQPEAVAVGAGEEPRAEEPPAEEAKPARRTAARGGTRRGGGRRRATASTDTDDAQNQAAGESGENAGEPAGAEATS